MSAEIPKSQKYYVNPKDSRQVRQYMAVMLIGSLLFSFSLVHPTAKWVMLLISLLYLPIIALSVLATVPKYNYREINNEGIRITTFGFIHKFIRWSTIGKLGKINLYGLDAVTIAYKPEYYPDGWKNFFYRKSIGWDNVVGNGYRPDGSSLVDDAIKQYSQYLRRTRR